MFSSLQCSRPPSLHLRARLSKPHALGLGLFERCLMIAAHLAQLLHFATLEAQVCPCVEEVRLELHLLSLRFNELCLKARLDLSILPIGGLLCALALPELLDFSSQ